MNYPIQLRHAPPEHYASPIVHRFMSRQGRAASLPQMTSPAAARKRSRPAGQDDVKVNESTEDDGRTKRCRGRPRKDTKDETAVDVSHGIETQAHASGGP